MDMVASLSLCDEPKPPRHDLPQTQRESLLWARSSPSEGSTRGVLGMQVSSGGHKRSERLSTVPE